MAKQSCFIRMGATALSVVVLFTQCLFAHKAQVNVWDERRAQPTQLASLPGGITTPRFQTNNLLNQLPSIAPRIPALPQWSGSNKKASAALPKSFRSLIDAIPLSAATIQEVYDSENAINTNDKIKMTAKTNVAPECLCPGPRCSNELKPGSRPNNMPGRRLCDLVSDDSINPPVVLIQDVHLNSEAQTNIATVLQALINEKQVGLVGVEGAFAPFDFKPFRELDKKITKQVVDSYLKHDMLAAPSYVGIVSPVEPPAFVGVDDKPHYKANVAAYLSTRKTKESLLNRLREMKTNLADEKRKTFSAKLQAFDIAQTRYHEGEIGIGEYAKKLSFYAQDSLERNFSQDRRPGNLLAGAQVLPRKNPGLPAEALAKAGSRQKDVPGRRALERENNLDLVMERFLAAYELETTLDFNRVDQERRSVIEALVKTLTEKETATLVAQSVAYRMGQLGFGDYYQSLKSLAQSKGVNLARTPAFDNYIRYVLLSDGIKADKLFESLEQLENSIRESLISTREEKILLTESEHLMLATKLINFSLTPPEWERYKALSIDGLRLTGSSSLSLPISSPRNVFARGPGFSINDELQPFEQFYVHADIRSHLMLENLLTTNSNAQASNPKEYSNANKSIESLKLDDWKLRQPTVLVVGGFHTPEISQILRDKKISYVVVTPKITKVDTAAGSEYLSVFAREKTPLDKLFEGEKLFVSPISSNGLRGTTGFKILACIGHCISGLATVVVKMGADYYAAHVTAFDPADAYRAVVTLTWRERLYRTFGVNLKAVSQGFIGRLNLKYDTSGVWFWFFPRLKSQSFRLFLVKYVFWGVETVLVVFSLPWTLHWFGFENGIIISLSLFAILHVLSRVISTQYGIVITQGLMEDNRDTGIFPPFIFVFYFFRAAFYFLPILSLPIAGFDLNDPLFFSLAILALLFSMIPHAIKTLRLIEGDPKDAPQLVSRVNELFNLVDKKESVPKNLKRVICLKRLYEMKLLLEVWKAIKHINRENLSKEELIRSLEKRKVEILKNLGMIRNYESLKKAFNYRMQDFVMLNFSPTPCKGVCVWAADNTMKAFELLAIEGRDVRKWDSSEEFDEPFHTFVVILNEGQWVDNEDTLAIDLAAGSAMDPFGPGKIVVDYFSEYRINWKKAFKEYDESIADKILEDRATWIYNRLTEKMNGLPPFKKPGPDYYKDPIEELERSFNKMVTEKDIEGLSSIELEINNAIENYSIVDGKSSDRTSTAVVASLFYNLLILAVALWKWCRNTEWTAAEAEALAQNPWVKSAGTVGFVLEIASAIALSFFIPVSWFIFVSFALVVVVDFVGGGLVQHIRKNGTRGSPFSLKNLKYPDRPYVGIVIAYAVSILLNSSLPLVQSFLDSHPIGVITLQLGLWGVGGLMHSWRDVRALWMSENKGRVSLLEDPLSGSSENMILGDGKYVPMGDIVGQINNVAYGIRGLKMFSGADGFYTAVSRDPATARANANEFHDHLRSLAVRGLIPPIQRDSQGEFVRNIRVFEWGIGTGRFASDFLDRLRELDSENKTTYLQRIQYVMGDFSMAILQEAKTTDCLKGYVQDGTVHLVQMNAAESLPFATGSALLVRDNEVFDDMPNLQLIEKIRNAASGQDEFYEVQGRIVLKVGQAITTMAGSVVTPEDFKNEYWSHGLSQLKDLNPDFLGRLDWEEELVPINIDGHPYGEWIRSFAKDYENIRFPLNMGALSNLRESLRILDRTREGYLDLYDYGPLSFSRAQQIDTHAYPWVRISNGNHATSDVNFPFLRDVSVREFSGARHLLESHSNYISRQSGQAPGSGFFGFMDFMEGAQFIFSMEDLRDDQFLPESLARPLGEKIQALTSQWGQADYERRETMWANFVDDLYEKGIINSGLRDVLKEANQQRMSMFAPRPPMRVLRGYQKYIQKILRDMSWIVYPDFIQRLVESGFLKSWASGLWKAIQDGIQRKFGGLVHFQIRQTSGVDFLEANHVIGIAIRKKSALDWNYKNGLVSKEMYQLIEVPLNQILSQPESVISFLPITKVRDNVGEHINHIFNTSILRMVQGNSSNSLTEQDIAACFMTPEVKVVRLENGEKQPSAPVVVHKPWGMEVWVSENNLFGIKFLYIMQGEHESLQMHKEKKESQLYFGAVDVLHLDDGTYQQRKTANGLSDMAPVEESEAFINTLPFERVSGDHLAIRSMPVGMVHTTRPFDGVSMNLEVSAGAEFEDPKGTTRLFDKYTEKERSQAAKTHPNWWGPRIPVSPAINASELKFTGTGEGAIEKVLPETDGVISLESNSLFNIDLLRISGSRKINIGGQSPSSEVIVVLEGTIQVEKSGHSYELGAGEFYVLPRNESLNILNGNGRFVHVHAPTAESEAEGASPGTRHFSPTSPASLLFNLPILAVALWKWWRNTEWTAAEAEALAQNPWMKSVGTVGFVLEIASAVALSFFIPVSWLLLVPFVLSVIVDFVGGRRVQHLRKHGTRGPPFLLKNLKFPDRPYTGIVFFYAVAILLNSSLPLVQSFVDSHPIGVITLQLGLWGVGGLMHSWRDVWALWGIKHKGRISQITVGEANSSSALSIARKTHSDSTASAMTWLTTTGAAIATNNVADLLSEDGSLGIGHFGSVTSDNASERLATAQELILSGSFQVELQKAIRLNLQGASRKWDPANADQVAQETVETLLALVLAKSPTPGTPVAGEVGMVFKVPGFSGENASIQRQQYETAVASSLLRYGGLTNNHLTIFVHDEETEAIVRKALDRVNRLSVHPLSVSIELSPVNSYEEFHSIIPQAIALVHPSGFITENMPEEFGVDFDAIFLQPLQKMDWGGMLSAIKAALIAA